MAYLPDAAYDALLNYIQDKAEDLHICSQEPTTLTEATTTYSLGSKTGITMAEPSNRTGGGRECVVSAITDGSVSGNGTATHWAIVKSSATAELLATGTLDASQVVAAGNPFTLGAFAVGVADAVAGA